MLGFSSKNSSAKSSKASVIEQRLRLIEQRLDRGTPTAATELADHVSESIGTVLSAMATRFLGRADLSAEGVGKFADAAGRFGNDAVRRLAQETRHRPLVTVAVGVGIGVLLGVSGRR
jgi:hypothetical protein